MQLRLAEIADAEMIVAVINAAFRNAEGFLVDGNRIDLQTVHELLHKGAFLVIDGNDNKMIGCVYVEPRNDRSYLGLLSVDPRYQGAGLGLGSQLMNAAEEYCAKTGSRFMDLRIVNVRKELPHFYHSRGYVETGTEPFTPTVKPKVHCHFVKMSKPLA